jgi:hypothetical protein
LKSRWTGEFMKSSPPATALCPFSAERGRGESPLAAGALRAHAHHHVRLLRMPALAAGLAGCLESMAEAGIVFRRVVDDFLAGRVKLVFVVTMGAAGAHAVSVQHSRGCRHEPTCA